MSNLNRKNMINVESLSRLAELLEHKEDIYYEFHGKMVAYDYVTLYNLKLIDVLSAIKDRTMFYNPEY